LLPRLKRTFDKASIHTANRAIGVLCASSSLAWAFVPAVGPRWSRRSASAACAVLSAGLVLTDFVRAEA